MLQTAHALWIVRQTSGGAGVYILNIAFGCKPQSRMPTAAVPVGIAMNYEEWPAHFLYGRRSLEDDFALHGNQWRVHLYTTILDQHTFQRWRWLDTTTCSLVMFSIQRSLDLGSTSISSSNRVHFTSRSRSNNAFAWKTEKNKFLERNLNGISNYWLGIWNMNVRRFSPHTSPAAECWPIVLICHVKNCLPQPFYYSSGFWLRCAASQALLVSSRTAR